MLKSTLSAPGVLSSPRGRISGKAFLIIFNNISEEACVVRLLDKMTIGREVPGNAPDIALGSPIVSRKHGVFSVSSEGYFYEDLGSFNGTFINGILYKSDVNPMKKPVKLKDGDVLRFDCRDANRSHKNAVTVVFSTSYDKRSKWRRYRPAAKMASVGVSAGNILEFDVNKMAFQSALISVNEFGCILKAASEKSKIAYNNSLLGGKHLYSS